MKIAIVDDMLHWQKAAEEIIREQLGSEAEQIDVFSCGEEFNYEKEYDIVFLDIEMPGIDGFETAIRYRENHEAAIIAILTTHQELMRKGYLVNAFRYIDKENMQEELPEALHALEVLQSRNYQVIFHEVHEGKAGASVKEILYVETEKRNVIIHTKEKDYVSNRSIESLEEELRDYGFFRSHKSYLVNLANIHDIKRGTVSFKNGSSAIVSSRKYTKLKDKYLEHRFGIANS